MMIGIHTRSIARAVAILAVTAGLTLLLDDYYVYVVTIGAIFATLAVAFDVLLGFTGYLSLAHGALYGVGAYACAILTARFGGVIALDAVSLTIPQGVIFGLIGPNGAGKTTLINMISGLISPSAGHILFDGQRGSWPIAQAVQHGIVRTFQQTRAFLGLSVRDNLRLGAYVYGEPQGRDYDAVFALFPILQERATQRAGLLSGGEQQMLALARALMSRPRLLLLDEPSQGLAPRAVDQVAHAIQSIARTGVAILLVEQNLMLAQQVAQHAVVLQTGICVADGRVSDMMASNIIQDSYLGRTADTGPATQTAS